MRSFLHLHQEGGFPAGQIVARPHPTVQLVHNSQAGFGSWYVTADLAEQHQESRLPEEGGLAGHVGTGYQAEPLAGAADKKIVCDKLPGSKVLFHNRVPSSLKLKHILIGKHGFAIGVGDCR